MTIHFDIDEKDGAEANSNRCVVARAVIHYGCGGSGQKVIIDWKQGTKATIVADEINVCVLYNNADSDTNTEGEFNEPNDQIITFRAHLTEGPSDPCGITNPATFTGLVWDLSGEEGSNTANIPIPRKAYQVQVLPSNAGVGNLCQASFIARVGGRVLAQWSLSGAADFDVPIPPVGIPQSARFLRIDNGAGAPINFAAIFSIAV